MNTVTEVTDVEHLKVEDGVISVIHFSASWAAQCQQMHDVCVELAKQYSNLKFFKIEAEDFPETSEAYEIAAVPTIVFVKNGAVVDRINGANVPELTKKAGAYNAKSSAPSMKKESAGGEAPKLASASASAVTAAAAGDLNTRLAQLVKAAHSVIFIKGSPQEPRCGFSRQLVAILDDLDAEYSYFNILTDEEVRQGLKTFSNWPTYPQVYIDGELVGGLDIIKEMVANGELKSMIKQRRKIGANDLDSRLKSLINQAPVMLFMKGKAEQPKCGFSNKIVSLLNSQNVSFDSFDILEDDEVRQGLKVFSNWPTFPQLYVNGELVGGLDIVQELITSGEFQSMIPK